MLTIINYPPKQRPNETDGNPFSGERRPAYSLVAKDIVDAPTAGLTDRPDVAPPVAAPPDVAPLDVAPKEPARLRLPSVDEFDFEEAFGAKRMARKFAPRFRNRGADGDRWNFPHVRNERDGLRNGNKRELPAHIAAPRSGGRGFFWGFCTSILIVLGTPAALGFVQPLNDLLPRRMGDVLTGISASLFDRADPSPGVEAADGDSNPDKSVPIPAQPVAAAVMAPVSKAPAAPAVQAPATGDVSAATESATPRSAASHVVAPDKRNKAQPRLAALPRAVEADPPQIADTKPATADEPVADESLAVEPVAEEPVSDAAQPVMSHLSAAQIDRLLARGEELLQSGNIASARLLFLRIAAAGDRRGARGVGMTYDPRVLSRLPVAGLTPDREQAEIWYRKAGDDSPLTTDRGTLADASTAQADTSKAQEPGSAEWNAACARKYESFEPSTGLYTAHSGTKRPCQLP